jgi:hypothetical protein
LLEMVVGKWGWVSGTRHHVYWLARLEVNTLGLR